MAVDALNVKGLFYVIFEHNLTCGQKVLARKYSDLIFSHFDLWGYLARDISSFDETFWEHFLLQA